MSWAQASLAFPRQPCRAAELALFLRSIMSLMLPACRLSMFNSIRIRIRMDILTAIMSMGPAIMGVVIMGPAIMGVVIMGVAITAAAIMGGGSAGAVMGVAATVAGMPPETSGRRHSDGRHELKPIRQGRLRDMRKVDYANARACRDCPLRPRPIRNAQPGRKMDCYERFRPEHQHLEP
jgi:hypothetical protein